MLIWSALKLGFFLSKTDLSALDKTLRIVGSILGILVCGWMVTTLLRVAQGSSEAAPDN
jgi:hypothetical protein